MITNVFQSGALQNTGGNINISTAVQTPSTEAYSITFQGALTGAPRLVLRTSRRLRSTSSPPTHRVRLSG